MKCEMCGQRLRASDPAGRVCSMCARDYPATAVGTIEPMPGDFHVLNHGSLFTVEPLTDAARAWLADHVAPEATYFGHALVVEPRYITDLMLGMRADGLTYT